MENEQKIIRCAQCEYFANGKQGFFCKNTSGMAYPGPSDFCSKAAPAMRDGEGGYTLEGLLTLAMEMRAKQ